VTEPAPEAIDAQIHVFAPDEPAHPWSPTVLHDDLYGGMRGRYAGRSARPAEVLAALDEHGVFGAVIVTPTVYGFDNGFSLEAHELAPERFRVVGLVDATGDDVEDAMSAWAAHPAAVGVRLNLWVDEAVARFFDAAYDRGAPTRSSSTIRTTRRSTSCVRATSSVRVRRRCCSAARCVA